MAVPDKTLSGRIIKEKRGLFTCEANGTLYACHAATRFRNTGIMPVAGDIVRFCDNGDTTGFITEILPRRNYFQRPHIANVDIFVIVITPAEPAPDLFVIDKLSCLAVMGGVQPVFVVNKNDVSDGAALAEIYSKCGFTVFRTRADCGDGAETVKKYIGGKTSVFCGASGVGKSSLLNALFPEAAAETGDLSLRIGRGKNTTRHTELFKLDCGGYIADTPGFSLLDISQSFSVEPDALADLFPEFEKYRYCCRYRGCTHTKDDGCAVTAAAERGEIPQSRIDSYAALYGDLKKHRWDKKK